MPRTFLSLVGNKALEELAGSHDRDRIVVFWKMAQVAGYQEGRSAAYAEYMKRLANGGST